ncbi:MAG: FecR domain-containing protein [Caulobacter sp.]|nr:FecR domain-containing protein [Caulobacter sp.]
MIHAIVRTDPSPPEDAAAEWLLRREAGHDIERDPDFVAWRDGAVGHAKAWNHATAVWDLVDGPVADDPLFAALRRDALLARPRRPAWTIAAMAAAVVVGVVLVAAPWIREMFDGRSLVAPQPSSAATYATGGVPQTIALADGSRVTLAANTAIAVDDPTRSRAVRLLRGEAYFSVVHDAGRPFEVTAAGRTITDIGTEFDVRLDDRAMTVTLAKGAVALSPAGGSAQALLLARPGQQVTTAPGRADRVGQADLTEALAWRKPLLDFSSTPLSQAADAVNRYGGGRVRIVDPRVAAIRISGQYRAGDPARFARAVADAYGLKVRMAADGAAEIVAR